VATDLTLENDGACLERQAVSDVALGALMASLGDTEGPGARLFGHTAVPPIVSRAGPLGALAARRLGPAARAVRAILFDKTARSNWPLGWHQDRVIAVKDRIEVSGYEPWTRKGGVWHVTPPFEVLAPMLTMRLHIDDVDADNAPLMIARGSHRLGRIAEADLDDVVDSCGRAVCLAQRGDVWLYATPIVHASEVAAKPHRRRVLQVDYAAADLPGGLQWMGV
jgi:hypothetical protein